MSTIPKILHCVWMGKGPKSKSVLKCMDSWKKYCPDYEIIIWNEDNYDIGQNHYANEAYNEKKWAFVSDYIRLDVLDKFGGIYLDCDVEIIKNIDHFLKYEAFASFEAGDAGSFFISSSLIGAKKDNSWIKLLKSHYEPNRSFYLSSGKIDYFPNTAMITDATVRKYKIKRNNELQHTSDFTLFPFEYFSPKSWKTKEITLTENTYAIHHFDASWIPENVDEGDLMMLWERISKVAK